MPKYDPKDIAWARAVAEEVLGGPWLAWTSGALMGKWKPQTRGRIFIGKDRFCFIVDGTCPTPDRVFVLWYKDLDPVGGTSKRFAPNAFVSFGEDAVFMGAKSAMRVLQDESARVQAAAKDSSSPD